MIRWAVSRLSRWICESRDICPLRGFKKVCGDGGDRPIIVSYHPIHEGIKECYARHLILCWNEWKDTSNRYIPSIHRIFGKILHVDIDLDLLQDICGVAVLHHDVGKLCTSYQSRNKTFYRHEMLSSFLIHDYIVKMLNDRLPLDEQRRELLSSIISAAIYLHHEGLQISHRYYELRAPTYSYLLNLLAGKEFYMIKGWKLISTKLEHWAFNKALDYFKDINSISGYEVANLLGSIITLIDGRLESLPLRLAVASILHPIMISDNLASLRRGGKPSRLSRFLGVMER